LELVGAGADRIHGGVVFETQKLYALDLASGLAGFSDSGGIFGRDEDRRRGVWFSRFSETGFS
jgi:hypothetical protein